MRQHVYKASTDINELLNYHLQESVNPKDPQGKPVPGENQQAGTLLTNAMQPLIDFIAINPKENWQKLLDKVGGYSMRRFLKEYTNYSENSIEYAPDDKKEKQRIKTYRYSIPKHRQTRIM